MDRKTKIGALITHYYRQRVAGGNQADPILQEGTSIMDNGQWKSKRLLVLLAYNQACSANLLKLLVLLSAFYIVVSR
jgi:hypothetical protein